MKNRLCESNEKYSQCISLGWFCGTASALNWNGLRGFSGPFDWCYSDLESVIYMMETGFEDFFNRENLKLVEGETRIFEDSKYNFYYNHEINQSFDDEIDKVIEKYKRRVDRFNEKITRPTVFFRAIRTNKEIEYIEKEYEHILEVIKKSNSLNEIVFLRLNDTKQFIENPNATIFNLDIKQYDGEQFAMLKMFNNSEPLIDFCKELLEEDERVTNLKYLCKTLSHEIILKEYELLLSSQNNYLVYGAMNQVLDVQRGIYIWGFGKYGKMVVNYLINIGVKIHAIIDKSIEIADKEYEGIRTILPSEVDEEYDIYISVVNKNILENIKKEIRDLNIQNHIAGSQDIYPFILGNR